MSVQAGVRCLCFAALFLGAAVSRVNVAFYPRWSDTRFSGAVIFSGEVISVLQCGGVCGTFGDACVVFAVQKVNNGVRCEIIEMASSPASAAGVHSYTTPRYVIAEKKPRYFFVSSSAEWDESTGACAGVNSSAALFRPDTRNEFLLVVDLMDKRDIDGEYWIDITHSNYPTDSFGIEGNHARQSDKRCAYMEKDKDHIHYNDCDDDLDGSVCRVFA